MYLSFYRLTHYNFRKYKQLSPPHANFSTFSQKKAQKTGPKAETSEPAKDITVSGVEQGDGMQGAR